MHKSILCVHLLDDFSGSAKVFATAVKVLQRAGHKTQVVIGSHGTDGFIRRQHKTKLIPYHFFFNRILLLGSFALVQLCLFVYVWRKLRTGEFNAVYVNTVLPVGAMLAGRFCRKPVITHLHEVGLGTKSLFKLLLDTALFTSTRLVVVSNYMKQALDLPSDRTSVIYNSIDSTEWIRAKDIYSRCESRISSGSFRVFMACSLKWYKGIDSFISLARHCRTSDETHLKNVTFILALNCETNDFTGLREKLLEDKNIELLHRPNSIYDHYQQADLVLNLSLPEGCIEAFGLTLLEAMSCGVPVVSPMVGGCTELFRPGCGGWHIDGHDIQGLARLIQHLSKNSAEWSLASKNAHDAATKFSPRIFENHLVNLFNSI